ncbi:MAG TPA: DUF1707 domain-containing protein [Streptosporangiaceae bacterium]
MNENMRVSDADREQVTARLREHFAEGRLTSEELDERISSALGAKTVGQLRGVMVDLPEPSPFGPGTGQAPPFGPGAGQVPPTGQQGQGPPPWAGRPGYYRRGPRLLPIAVLLLFTFFVLPGVGWAFFAFLKIALLIWLVTILVGAFSARRNRHRSRRRW